MADYDWRAEVRKRLGIEATERATHSLIELDKLYEHARETLGIPKAPPEPTDEELLGELWHCLGKAWDPSFAGNVGALLIEATKRGEVWIGDPGGMDEEDRIAARVGGVQGADGPTPAEALRSALAAWLRAEWRREQGGGE